MMMLGSPPLLGILQCRLAPANNSSRDLSQATGQHVDQQQAASESLHTQENQLLDNQGTEKFSGYHNIITQRSDFVAAKPVK